MEKCIGKCKISRIVSTNTNASRALPTYAFSQNDECDYIKLFASINLPSSIKSKIAVAEKMILTL